jgi:hypothetical protein
VGLDAPTGAVRWTIPRLPTVARRDDARWLTVSPEIVVATSTQPDLVAGCDAATGEQLWRTVSDQGSVFDDRLTSDEEVAYLPFANG